ncbi:MAG: hypothetical protein EBT05_02740 [Betaproteobacteria bacterium]|nr:hypothetical protein [Betaproteobacteria bacterium]
MSGDEGVGMLQQLQPFFRFARQRPRFGLQGQVEGTGDHRTGAGPQRIAGRHLGAAGLGVAKVRHRPAMHDLGMRQPDRKAPGFADMDGALRQFQGLQVLAPVAVQHGLESIGFALAEGVLQAYRQGLRLVGTGHRVVAQAARPLCQCRIAQAHDGGVLYLARPLLKPGVGREAAVHPVDCNWERALMKQQVGHRPVGLQPAHGIG